MATLRRRKISQQSVAPSEPAGVVALGVLEKSIGYALRRAQVAVFADFMTHIGAVGLRPAQFSILVVVRDTPGLKQSVVADALGIQRTNFVAMIDELQKRSWLDRRPADRRSYALHLTQQGEAKVGEALALHAAAERRIGRLLGPTGRAQLLEQLRAIAGALPHAAEPNG